MKLFRTSTVALLISAALCASAQESPKTALSGSVENGTYRNTVFGFSYKLPFGWVDRTEDMQKSSSDPAKSQVLLAVFERPPEATAKTVNSAVIIATESTSSYPGLKAAGQYFGPISQLAAEKGFKQVNEPYDFPVDAKLLARADYIKQLSSIGMYQSSLVLLSNGYVVSFTFISGSDDEVNALIDSLSFGRVKKPAKSPSAR